MTPNPRTPTPAAAVETPPVTAGLPLPTKPLALHQLQAEMRAAGLNIRMLGTSARYQRIFDHDANGVPSDLPPGAQAVIDAHVPMPPIDFGVNAEELDRSRVQAFINTTNAYLQRGAANTPGQVRDQVDRNARALLTLIKMVRGTNG